MPYTRLKLHEIENVQCLKGCPKEIREELDEDSLCSLAHSEMDGMLTRCVGGWAQEKIYFLKRYFEIFASGMKKKWDTLGYFEIGCGPGRCINRENAVEFDGSSLAILQSEGMPYISTARFVDIENEVVRVLNDRIKELSLERFASAVTGSYKNADEIASLIYGSNPSGLNLVFFDPTDCSVPFSTIEAIKNMGIRFDLIINIATKSDFTRNIDNAIKLPNSNVREKYETFLGDSSFFSSPQLLQAYDCSGYNDIRSMFIETYKNRLRTLGFKHFGREEINGYYELLFASKSPTGLSFWNRATKTIEITGQRDFDWQ